MNREKYKEKEAETVSSAPSSQAYRTGNRQLLNDWNKLTPLTDTQVDVIFDLTQQFKNLHFVHDVLPSSEVDPSQTASDKPSEIESSRDFFNWFEGLENEVLAGRDEPYEDYRDRLDKYKTDCDSLLEQVDNTLHDFDALYEDYVRVSTKTNALHLASEQLLADQNKLIALNEDIKKKLHYFSQVENLTKRLNSPTLSVSSEAFFSILNKIDECMDYLKNNISYKGSQVYLVKYGQCLTKALGLIKSYVNHVLKHATDQILAPRPASEVAQPEESSNASSAADAAFALFFGKFQAAAPKLKEIFYEVELRVGKSEDYANLLSECQQTYLMYRAQVIWGAVDNSIKELLNNHKGDHCLLVRSACSFIMHICQDEWDLFFQFFSQQSPLLSSYLAGFCNMLYDTLRPYIIHINHLETLAELCTILKIEILEEQVKSDPDSLDELGRVSSQLLQDCQERLAYRATVCLRSDVLNYKPAPGDLAYPEKLIMMEQIAQSLQESSLKRSDSHSSMVSVGSATSMEVANINNDSLKHKPSSSPADLHGMWYPGVRRTLATLSRLYRCLEKPVFQGLSQEALELCVTNVANAAQQISANKTKIDGELFQIKHLLILREQIAPFQVDFTVKETSLDFSKVKNAAYGLIQHRNQLFALNGNNALLEFLLEGTPTVKEQLLDSRKEVDRQLKSSCELFIKHSTDILISPIVNLIETQNVKPNTTQEKASKISPHRIQSALLEARKMIKSNLAPLQRSMQLYLANKETEFILFRPIRNNVIGNYMQMETILSGGDYTEEEILIAGCPTTEQASILLSSAGLSNAKDNVQPFGGIARKISVAKPPSRQNSVSNSSSSNAVQKTDNSFVA